MSSSSIPSGASVLLSNGARKKVRQSLLPGSRLPLLPKNTNILPECNENACPDAPDCCDISESSEKLRVLEKTKKASTSAPKKDLPVSIPVQASKKPVASKDSWSTNGSKSYRELQKTEESLREEIVRLTEELSRRSAETKTVKTEAATLKQELMATVSEKDMQVQRAEAALEAAQAERIQLETRWQEKFTAMEAEACVWKDRMKTVEKLLEKQGVDPVSLQRFSLLPAEEAEVTRFNDDLGAQLVKVKEVLATKRDSLSAQLCAQQKLYQSLTDSRRNQSPWTTRLPDSPSPVHAGQAKLE
eukprot:GILK01003814.1.p1 GENE.GILK01003814.1~~GILK01003814.1.p1  ORF type:complete len:302 (+),score=72.76 GILK01003814.1:39-944(+)